MRRLTGACLALIATLSCSGGRTTTTSAPRSAITAIVGATLLDGNGGEPLRDSVVVVNGARIQEVGRRGAVAYPSDANVVDATGRFIIPGLIDSHVHYRHWLPELMFAHGITSVVDLGNETEWILAMKDGIEKGRVAGPRIFTAANYWNSAPGNNMYRMFQLSEVLLDNPVQARPLVRGMIAHGIDVVKVYTHLRPDLIEAVSAEAHGVGLKVFGDLDHLMINAREAALAGVDCIVHARGIAISTIKDPAVRKRFEAEYLPLQYVAGEPWYLTNPADYPEFIQFLVHRNVAIQPTSNAVWKGVHDRRAADVEETRAVFRNPALQYVPRRIIDARLDYSRFDDLSPEELSKVRQGYEKFKLFIKAFADAGGTLLAGSDLVNSGVPGLGFHHELELLVDAGLSPIQVLAAATKQTAAFIGKGNQLGTLETGKLADLVVLKNDPRADIANLRKGIDRVMKNGEFVDTAYHASFASPLPRDESQQTWGRIPATISITPEAVPEGSAAVVMTVRTTSFARKSVAKLDGQQLPTDFINRQELRAHLDAPLFAKPGVHAITVTRTDVADATPSLPATLVVRFR